LDKVLQNIGDPNTDAEATRTITLKIKIKPDENRELAGVQIDAESKLAPHRPVGTSVFVGKKDGRVVAVENNPRQPGIFDDDSTKKTMAQVHPINDSRRA